VAFGIREQVSVPSSNVSSEFALFDVFLEASHVSLEFNRQTKFVSSVHENRGVDCVRPRAKSNHPAPFDLPFYSFQLHHIMIRNQLGQSEVVVSVAIVDGEDVEFRLVVDLWHDRSRLNRVLERSGAEEPRRLN